MEPKTRWDNHNNFRNLVNYQYRIILCLEAACKEIQTQMAKFSGYHFLEKLLRAPLPDVMSQNSLKYGILFRLFFIFPMILGRHKTLSKIHLIQFILFDICFFRKGTFSVQRLHLSYSYEKIQAIKKLIILSMNINHLQPLINSLHYLLMASV